MTRHSIITTVAPAAEPVSLSDVKTWLRIDGTAEDALLADLIPAAREMAENFTRRAFINRTLKLTLDALPRSGPEPWWDGVREIAITELTKAAAEIAVPFPPLVSVSSIVTYDTSDGAATMDPANYQVDTAGGRIALKSGASWPTDLRSKAGIEVTYVAGYGASAATVPYTIRRAILMIIAGLYHDRECGEMPGNAQAALRPYIRITDGRNVV